MLSIEIKENGVPAATVLVKEVRPTEDGFYEYSYSGARYVDQKSYPKVFGGSVEWKQGASVVGLAAMILEDANDQI